MDKPFGGSNDQPLAEQITKLDFYRSVPSDLTAKSKAGGVISIATILVIVVLLYVETREFYAEKRYSTIMVERIKGVDEIAVDMDLTLHEYHCKDVLIWYRQRNGKVIGKLDLTQMQLTDTEEGVTGCHIAGTTKVSKVPGYLEVTLKRAGSRNITLPHEIAHLMLGENVYHGDETVWGKDIPEIVFNPLRNHYGEEGEGEDIEYHLQLVHTAIEFEMNGPQYDPYQYTFSVKKVKTRDHFPGIKFFFDWSPITIKYGVKDYYHADLLGKGISIVGGIFTLALFLHTLLISSANNLYEKAFLSSTKLGA